MIQVSSGGSSLPDILDRPRISVEIGVPTIIRNKLDVVGSFHQLSGFFGVFGLFGTNVPHAGSATNAGPIYTANEQAMLTACYTILRTCGFIQ